MELEIPELSLVFLIGASGSGKSTFAKRHFLPTEIVSSDVCRGLVSDDENNQRATGDAFDLLRYLVGIRLKRGLLTVIDATNVQRTDRANLIALARQWHVLPVAIVFNVGESICSQRNADRADRRFNAGVVRTQMSQLRRGLRGLKREGFRKIHHFHSAEEVDSCTGIQRVPLWNNRRDDSGPFDIIGDVHGCRRELDHLLESLGYGISDEHVVSHSEGRRLVFVGDLADRGPDSVGVFRLVMNSVAAGNALCVPGNHDVKLLRYLKGKNVQQTHGLAGTIEQVEGESAEFREELTQFLDDLVSHYVFNQGKLVIAHAGLKEEMQGRGSSAVREFCLYGDTTGEMDEFGLPERLDWASDYRGNALVVYGHTPFVEPRWLNNTVNIDTGCAFGGKLTALRYPEKETVSVEAFDTYAKPARPLRDETGGTAQQEDDRLLDLADILGKMRVHTALFPSITVSEEQGMAALEVMSRFAIDPRWLIYLPPTMSPCATSEREGWLERPEEVFDYFRGCGVEEVVCEEKHMGSRAVLVIARSAEAAASRFGTDDGRAGVIYTRTGRPFFGDKETEAALVALVNQAMEKSGLWDELMTLWVCLDAELMPWSVKARELITSQYASVGAAGQVFCECALRWTDAGILASEDPDLVALHERLTRQSVALRLYRKAYSHYHWDVVELTDLRLAPFHILASEGAAHDDKPHRWHMEHAERLADVGNPILMATPWRTVDLADDAAIASAVNWWEEITSQGSEGFVMKPASFVERAKKGLIQPAVKCRGREYLRLIYGPDYDAPANLERLRKRGLGRKRSLALREFALGLESLHRFVDGRPLRDVHACVFALLALESEPVDPRL